MDEVLCSTLRTAVYSRLDYLDTIAVKADNESKTALADTEIPRLTGAWRALLNKHEPDERGRCRTCAPWPAFRRAECTVWQIAHRHLISKTTDTGNDQTGRHSLRAPRPAAT